MSMYNAIVCGEIGNKEMCIAIFFIWTNPLFRGSGAFDQGSLRRGGPVAQNNSETMVMPTELSTTNKTPRTNEPVQGDLLREYERKFTHLPDDLRLIGLCSDAGIMKTVAKGQYFMTRDDVELDKLGGSCREYTLSRDDTSSKVKGWIPRNTKIRPVLEVAVSYHQGRYGIEIMIKSTPYLAMELVHG